MLPEQQAGEGERCRDRPSMAVVRAATGDGVRRRGVVARGEEPLAEPWAGEEERCRSWPLMAVVRTATEDGVCRRGVVARAEEHLAGEREPRGGVEMTSLAKQGRRRAGRGRERSGWQQAHGEAATERLGGGARASGRRCARRRRMKE